MLCHKLLHELRHKPTYLLWLIASCSPLAQALPEDRNQPVHISADSAVQENETATYRGNVVVTQGTIRLNADQVVVLHATGKVQKITATGKPARFQQQQDPKGGLVKASATTLVYYQGENRFELLQDAQVERADGTSLKGNHVDYLPTSQTVRAQGTLNNQSGRVEMVLPPEPISDDKAPAPPQPAPAAP